ncbi:MAG: GAF domain-containing protein, partial [Candidatus Rokubacteria bacterium]|nr:GAF domain-containing protein [Candidatus Rokubacteria bacterium]
VAARPLGGDLLERFRERAAADMGLFADWQRAAVAAFAVDLGQCRACHEADWKVRDISRRFHTARSFRGRRYFTVALGDGFRYAFAPLDLGGRRVGMLVVRQTLDPVVAARRQTALAFAGGAVGVVAMTFAAWWRVSRRLARGVASLQRWTDALADGRAAPAPAVRVADGVDHLTQSLTTTVGALRASRDRIEQENAHLQALVATQSSRLSSMEQRLVTLTTLAEAPARVPEPDDVSGEVLRHVLRLVGAPSGRLVLFEVAGDDVPRCLALVGDGPVTPVSYADDCDPVLLSAARRSRLPFHVGPALAPTGGAGAAVVPLALRGHTLGVLVLTDRADGSTYDAGDLETLATLGHQAAMAIEHALLYRRAQETYLNTTGVLVTTIEEKDPYLRGHGDRVSRRAVTTATALGMTNGDLRRIVLLGRFHDVGKICIDSSVLLKPGRLTIEEYEAVKRHAEIGEAIVGRITSLRDAAFIIGQHYERYDGRGYPRGVGGDEISLASRVIAVCDTFDAMTSARPYRPALVAARAVDELRGAAGTQLDPLVVDAFCAALATPGPAASGAAVS